MIKTKDARKIMPTTINKEKTIEQFFTEIEEKIYSAARDDKTYIIIDSPPYDIAIKKRLENYGYDVKINGCQMVIGW